MQDSLAVNRIDYYLEEEMELKDTQSATLQKSVRSGVSIIKEIFDFRL